MAKKHSIIVIGEDGEETKKTYTHRNRNKEINNIGFAMLLCTILLMGVGFGYSLNSKIYDMSPINANLYGVFIGITTTLFLLSIFFSNYGEEKIIDLRIKEAK